MEPIVSSTCLLLTCMFVIVSFALSGFAQMSNLRSTVTTFANLRFLIMSRRLARLSEVWGTKKGIKASVCGKVLLSLYDKFIFCRLPVISFKFATNLGCVCVFYFLENTVFSKQFRRNW